MRNSAFVPLVMQLARQAPGVKDVRTLAEDGDTKYPLGFSVETVKSKTRWQAIQRLADNESHDRPAADVEDAPASWDDAQTHSADAWLATLIGRAAMPQIAKIEHWSEYPDAGEDEGVTVYFHNGARSFLRRLR